MAGSLLLTGANGQVGWEVARRAGAAGLACRARGHGELDIARADAVEAAVAALRPDVVVNAAGYTDVDRAETDRATAFAVNRDGAANLAGACARHGALLIQLSTDYVFDGRKATPYREDDPVAPLNVYGASKLAGEAAVREGCPRHLILRTAWVYGVHGRNFVKSMLRLGRERESLRVVADQVGCPTFAGDLADVILALAGRAAADGIGDEGLGTFHVAGRGETSWCGFARGIFELAGAPANERPGVEAIPAAEFPTPAHRPANSRLDSARLERTHGLSARSWEVALPDMLAALKAVRMEEGA